MSKYDPLSPEKKKGNPNWKKGFVANPAGRPKGSVNKHNRKIKDALVKLNKDPIEELIYLADCLKTQREYAKAAEIWMEIQTYLASKRKAVEVHETPLSPEESKENVEQTLKLLEEISNNDTRTEESSNTSSLENRESSIQTPTNPEESL